MGLEHVELNYKETIILILIDKYYKINNNSTLERLIFRSFAFRV